MGRTKGAVNKPKIDVMAIAKSNEVVEDNQDFITEVAIKRFYKIGRFNVSYMIESNFFISEDYEKLSNFHMFKVIDQKGTREEKNVFSFIEFVVITPKGKTGYIKYSDLEIKKIFNFCCDNIEDVFKGKINVSKYATMLQDNQSELFEKIPVRIKAASYECNQLT